MAWADAATFDSIVFGPDMHRNARGYDRSAMISSPLHSRMSCVRVMVCLGVHAMKIEIRKKGRRMHAQAHTHAHIVSELTDEIYSFLWFYHHAQCSMHFGFGFFCLFICAASCQERCDRVGMSSRCTRMFKIFIFCYPPILRCIYNEINDHTTYAQSKQKGIENRVSGREREKTRIDACAIVSSKYLRSVL